MMFGNIVIYRFLVSVHLTFIDLMLQPGSLSVRNHKLLLAAGGDFRAAWVNGNHRLVLQTRTIGVDS